MQYAVGRWVTLQSQLQTMSADGYFYTYVTNLAQTKVYYNNFTVHHMRGNIRQINDYYPYGLTWSRPEGDDARMYQNKQWQQNEWGEGKGLEMYDFHARMYDPVLARWHAPDPMNQFDSPYNAMGNNPVVNIDPDGMQVPWAGILSALGSAVVKAGTTTTINLVEHAFTYGVEMVAEKKTATSSFAKGLNGILQLASSMLAWGEGSEILRDGQRNLGAEASANMKMPAYINNSTRGFQVHYTNQNGESASVSITKLTDEELFMALINSGCHPFVLDVIGSFKYLSEADRKNRNILGRMAKSRRTTDIWETKDMASYKMKTTGPDIDSQKGVHWSPTKGLVVDYLNHQYQTPAMGLFFEIGHAFMRMKHPLLFWFLNLIPTSFRFVDGQERFNLNHYEIPVALDIPGEAVRFDQTGGGIELSGPTSHNP